MKSSSTSPSAFRACIRAVPRCTRKGWITRSPASLRVMIPLDGRIALAAAGFADLHRDSADRFIAASAAVRSATLVTADEKLLAWNSTLPRLDARR